MTTLHLSANSNLETAIATSAKLLLHDELVAFPTETVYGLGARIFSESAISKIYEVKGRPTDNPLISHVATIEQVSYVAINIPDEFYQLAERFFPGSLTIVLQRHKSVPSIVSAGLDTIAVRMPANTIALELIKAVGEPLVAPSANLSGKPSPTSAQHVLDDLNGRIAAVIDGGKCTIGIESTVLNILSDKPQILRPGSVTREQIEDVLGRKVYVRDSSSDEIPISPGMKYRHYAPSARIRLVHSLEELGHLFENNTLTSRLLLANNVPNNFINTDVHPLLAESIYAEFRRADAENFSEIVILCDNTIMKEDALMNRISKAASNSQFSGNINE